MNMKLKIKLNSRSEFEAFVLLARFICASCAPDSLFSWLWLRSMKALLLRLAVMSATLAVGAKRFTVALDGSQLACLYDGLCRYLYEFGEYEQILARRIIAEIDRMYMNGKLQDIN